MKQNFLRLAVVSGMLITLNQTGYAQDWHLTGNAGTTPGTHFLGTTDAKGLHFRTKNTTRMAITNGGKIGIGLTAPTAKFQIENAGNAYSVFSFSNDNNATKDSIMVMASNGNVGIGTAAPAYQLDVEGKATSPSFYNFYSKVNFVGTSDIRAITAYSHPADGWGLGVEATGGFYGGLFNGLGGTYTGSTYGVYGSASGTAGTRYGVYGSASNTGGPAWAGYFSGNTYASNLVVGSVSTAASGYTLTVGGKIIATEVRVQLTPFPDYVFEKSYSLLSVYEVEAFINQHKHLPGMPTACEVEDNGMGVGEMQGKLVEKVEEQTLYIIQLQKQIDELRMEIKAMKK